MSQSVQIHVPRENVNDESVKLIEWIAANNTPVREGQAIAEIETSKSSAQVFASHDGILKHAAKVGAEVAVGGLIAYVEVEGEPAIPAVSESVSRVEVPVRSQVETDANAAPIVEHLTRFSNKAIALMREHNLAPTAFAKRDLVTATDVLEHVGLAKKNHTPTPPPANAAAVAPATPRPALTARPPWPSMDAAYASICRSWAG